jgi:hypothetical protein
MPNEQLAAIPALWFHEGSGGALLSRIKQGFMDHLSRLYGLMMLNVGLSENRVPKIPKSHGASSVSIQNCLVKPKYHRVIVISAIPIIYTPNNYI